MRSYFLICAALGLLAFESTPARAQPEAVAPHSEPQLSVEEIVSRMVERERAQEENLRGYTSHRRYRVHNRRFNKTAEMLVRLTYTHPGTKTFDVLEQSGPSAVRQRVIRKMLESETDASDPERRNLTQISPANYNFRLSGMENDEGRAVYVVAAEPKTRNKYLLRGDLWIDTEDFAIVRIEGKPAKNPSIWVRDASFIYQYAKVGEYWFPSSTRSEAQVLVFGTTDLEIVYDRYEISGSEDCPPATSKPVGASCGALPRD